MRTVTDIVSMELAVCYALHDLERATGTELTPKLDAYADRDLKRRQVYEVLYDLRDRGLVTQTKDNKTRGEFRLSDEGREKLVNHHEWATQCLGESSAGVTF